MNGISALTVVRDGLKPWKVLARQIERIRPYVDEHLVIVDARTEDDTAFLCASLGCRVEVVDAPGPSMEYGLVQEGLDRAYTRWVVWCADDELPSYPFLRAMRKNIALGPHIFLAPLLWLTPENRVLNIRDNHPVLFPSTSYIEKRVHAGPSGYPIHHLHGLPYWHFALDEPIGARAAKLERYVEAFGGHEGPNYERARAGRYYLPEKYGTETVSLWRARRF